jgi:hypothetical protein
MTSPIGNIRAMSKLDIIADQVKLMHQNTKEGKRVHLTLPWKLHKYCQDELDEVDGGYDLNKVLTVTGNSTKAYAATCREYLERYWPRCPFNILNLINKMMKVMKTRPGMFNSLRVTQQNLEIRIF